MPKVEEYLDTFEQQFTDLFVNFIETGSYREVWWACYAPLLATYGLCEVTRK